MSQVLASLMATIEERRRSPCEGSYTCLLFDQGLDAIAAKITEESNELIEAAGQPAADRPQRMIHEMADTLYHLCVLLGYCQVPWSAVEQELLRRFGRSGLDEKASRQP